MITHPPLPTPLHNHLVPIRDHENPASLDTLPSMSLDPASLMRPYKPTSSHRRTRQLPPPPTPTWPNIASITATMAILQKTVKHSKINSKNWCVLVTFAALSAEKITLLDPAILLVPTTNALSMTLITINAPTKTPNQLAPTSPPPTLPYAALSTPSPVVLLVEDLPLLPERNTLAISNPSTTLPIPVTDVAYLP